MLVREISDGDEFEFVLENGKYIIVRIDYTQGKGRHRKYRRRVYIEAPRDVDIKHKPAEKKIARKGRR